MAWKLQIPGRGWSSPIVWGDHVFVVAVTTEGQDEAPKPGIYASHMQVRSDAVHHWSLYDIDFGGFGLFALDFSGTLLWSKDLGALNNANASFIAAYDARTGVEAWRVPREESGTWSTAFVWEHDLRTEIVTAGTTTVRSFPLLLSACVD